MKQIVHTIIALVALLSGSTTAWAGETQTIRLVTTGEGMVTVKVGESTLAFDGDGKSTTTVAAVATITLTVTPTEGHYTEALSVNKTVAPSAAPSLAPRRTGDVSIGDIALTLTSGNGNLHESNTYTFTMPSSDYSGVNIVVTFAARTNVSTTGEGAVTIADIAAQTYTSQAITPELTVKHGETTLTAGKDYTVAYDNNTNVSTNATATVSFIGRYNANANTLSKTFVINKAPLTVTAKPKTITYGDAPANDGVEYDGFVGEENSAVLGGTLDYTYSYAQFGNVGSYTITPSGLTSDNYDITFTAGTLTVSKAPLTITANDKSVTYGDAVPEYTVTYSGFVNKETESVLGGFLNIACTYTQGGNAGIYDITPSGFSAQNYAITYVKGTLTVNPASVTLTANSDTKEYNGAEQTLTGFTCSVNGLTFTGVTASGSGTNTGDYDVTFTGVTLNTTKDDTGNYVVTGTTNGKLTISYYTTTLADNTNNNDEINNIISNYGGKANVTLTGRTLQTGGWNTFCAPFDTDIPSGWTVKTLTGSAMNGNALTLTFGNATTIEAGKPYMVKVTSTVANPVFSGVTIASGTTSTTTSYVDFVPVMNPTELTGGDKTVLFVKGGNTLTYPTSTANINGFRAYFQLHDATNANSFVMDFEDDATSLSEELRVKCEEYAPATEWYTLDGCNLSGKPTAKGIYVRNGVKVVVK